MGGDPGGTVYLIGGCLAFAESSAVPDLGSRLVNSRRLGVDQWRRAQFDSQPDGSAGDLLLRWGLLDAAEWQALLRSAALDALLALAIQLTQTPAAAGTSFIPRQAHPVGSVRLDTGWAWRHAWQEAERLARYDVGPGARLRLCGRDHLVFSAEAAAVLGQIDGRATIRELAWRNGLALFGVMDWAARLIQDGVCAIAAREGREGAGPRWARPDPDLLRQVLTELRQLS